MVKTILKLKKNIYWKKALPQYQHFFNNCKNNRKVGRGVAQGKQKLFCGLLTAIKN
jgi:hypothetical protein